MNTRAIIAYAAEPGSWKGVWHDEAGQPQNLGRVLTRRATKVKGDLAAFAAEVIDGCPEGWVDLGKGTRRGDPAGLVTGQFDGIVATCDGAPAARFLYLLYLPKRRLFVFEVKPGPLRPFGLVTFDAGGVATPRALPKFEEPS